jgi:hypothetical protein
MTAAINNFFGEANVHIKLKKFSHRKNNKEKLTLP